MEDTISCARPASPWPTWAPNISPPTWVISPDSGPACAAISGGTTFAIAATTCVASGSHSADQTGSVRSIHSPRDQDSIVRTPDGRSVAGSSHRSASRTASATCSRSAGVTPGLSPASADIATCLARSQFTGPPDQESSFCSSANKRDAAERSPAPAGPGAAGLVVAGPKPNGRFVMSVTVVLTNDARPLSPSARDRRCADGERGVRPSVAGVLDGRDDGAGAARTGGRLRLGALAGRRRSSPPASPLS